MLSSCSELYDATIRFIMDLTFKTVCVLYVCLCWVSIRGWASSPSQQQVIHLGLTVPLPQATTVAPKTTPEAPVLKKTLSKAVLSTPTFTPS